MSYAQNFVQFYETQMGTAAMDREAEYIEQFVDPGDRILNVGAGVGEMERRFTEYDIVGLDASRSMLAAACGRTSAPLVLGDATSLPFAADTFDAVSFVATLEFIQDADAALSETVRVTKPDGSIVVEIMNTESAYVQANLEMEGSYFQQMVHRDSPALADTVESHVAESQREYFLGIGEEELYHTDDPGEAAVLAVAGTPGG